MVLFLISELPYHMEQIYLRASNFDNASQLDCYGVGKMIKLLIVTTVLKI